jgi:hypothetical protein
MQLQAEEMGAIRCEFTSISALLYYSRWAILYRLTLLADARLSQFATTIKTRPFAPQQ